MDRLEAMSILVAVADGGSLSAASRKLGTPLATVSRKIAALEAHLKIQLLSRSSRRAALTDAGRSYVESCRRVLEQIEEIERTASGEFTTLRGHLTLTAPVVIGRLHVLPLLVEFLRLYPDIDLRLVLSDHIIDVLADHIDLAVRIGFPADSGLIAARVGTTRRVLCGSPAYFAARGHPHSLEDLEGHDCVAFENLAPFQNWTFRDGQGERTLPIRPRLSVSTAEAAIDAATAGLGITRVLSYMIEPARRDGRLALTLEDFEPAPWPINLVHHGQRFPSPKLRVLLDWLSPRLKARLPA